MKLRTVPAGQGLKWVREGFRTLGKRPMAFVGLASAVVFASLVLPRVSVLLTLVFAAAAPLFTLGFMNAAKQRELATRSALASFVEGMRLPQEARRPMLMLCAAYTVAAFLAGLVVTAGYGESLAVLSQSMPGTPPADPPAAGRTVADGRLVVGVLVQMVIGALLAIPFWHAPALVRWGGQSAGQAVFSSTVAIWRNRGAFATYALGFFGLAMLLIVIGAPLLGLLGGGQLVTMAVFSLLLLIPAAFYGSLYWTFADCFETSDPLAVLPPPTTP